jgi:hypothetical protein
VVVAALAAVLVTGACSEEHAGTLPTQSPSVPSATATPSASPTVSATDALVAAARTYYAVLEDAGKRPASGAARVDALIDHGCACRRVVDFLRDTSRAGRRIERPVRVLDPRATSTASGGTVFLTLDQLAGRVVDAKGRVVERLAPSRVRVVIDFRRTGNRFLVTQISGPS